jgi:hypothetical protein
VENVAHRVVLDDSNTRKSGSVLVASALATIDNVNYSYAFRVCNGAIQNSFRSARIRYTYNNAGE